MAPLKELHLARRLEDLEKHTIIPDIRTKKIRPLLESARKLQREAEKFACDGDEELAYIFYMKYFNMLNGIHKKPDYQEHKNSVRQALGNNAENMLLMDKLEKIGHSLTKRYNRLNDSARSITPAVTPSPTSRIQKPSEDSRSYEQLSASEKFDLLKSGTLPEPPAEPLSPRSMRLISCKELFDHMQKNSVLIMDCRAGADYNQSHLSYTWAFNVPEELILAGMSAGKLQDKLDSQCKSLWSARSVKDQVVLMDWYCKDISPTENSSIGVLLDILQNWDPDVIYRSPIRILDGGYEYFIMMYPTLCTNPSVQAPQLDMGESDIIDDIEYPSIYDITMKDEVREHGYALSPKSGSALDIERGGGAAFYATYPARPSVDRASKQAALKAYDEKQKPIGEILKEQEELLEKAQENDAQLQAASKQLDNIFAQKGADESIAKQNDLGTAEQELLYNIMQLESVAEDYKIENNRLRHELEKYKRLEREQQEQLAANDVANVEEATKQIETKLQERQKLDEQHELERQQRARQWAIAREHKRHHIQPTPSGGDEDEEEYESSSKPKIPQFDRSVKPHVIANTVNAASIPYHMPLLPNISTVERTRDFSPVPGGMGRGLTGLKNLGNTCYMNSILQCLSNTPQLTEYCITDKYKNYISRTNKTQGQIVEEVAALIKILWTGNYKCVASKDLRYVIGQYQQIFRGIEQQDSHEFLTILMDWLHSDLQTLRVPEKTRDNISASEKAWLDFTKCKESLILHLFYGQIKSTVKCVQCNKESATYESFSNLSLELPSNANFCYLSQCMDMYFSGEPIHGWNCPSCKQKRDAVKKLDISKLPPVLVVHLKRFYADPDAVGNAYKKKQNYVRFPLDNLDMSPYIAKSELRSVNPKTYQLYGVSNHYGTMEGGHYTAFCKSGNYGRWFKFDDQMVTPLDTSNVVSSGAYILFYTWLPPIQINAMPLSKQ